MPKAKLLACDAVVFTKYTRMFGLFKKETQQQKLEKQYKKLLEESYQLSSTDRKASDAKAAEAEEIAKKLAEMS